MALCVLLQILFCVCVCGGGDIFCWNFKKLIIYIFKDEFLFHLILLFSKVLSFGLRGRPSSYSENPARYRIHTSDRRIATKQAQYVF